MTEKECVWRLLLGNCITASVLHQTPVNKYKGKSYKGPGGSTCPTLARTWPCIVSHPGPLGESAGWWNISHRSTAGCVRILKKRIETFKIQPYTIIYCHSSNSWQEQHKNSCHCISMLPCALFNICYIKTLRQWLSVGVYVPTVDSSPCFGDWLFLQQRSGAYCFFFFFFISEAFTHLRFAIMIPPTSFIV